MKSYLQELENNEAILLMYLADELPPQDRLEVEQMLASDANLRAELELLRQTQDAGLMAMADLDRGSRFAVPESVAVKKVVRLINQRQLQKQQAVVVHEPAPARKVPWLTYSLSAAAVLLVGSLIWWGNQTETLNREPHNPIPPAPWPMMAGPITTQEKRALLMSSFDSSAADDAADLQVAAIAPKADDSDFSFDINRPDTNKTDTHGGDGGAN